MSVQVNKQCETTYSVDLDDCELDALLMAHFRAVVPECADLPDFSINVIYHASQGYVSSVTISGKVVTRE